MGPAKEHSPKAATTLVGGGFVKQSRRLDVPLQMTPSWPRRGSASTFLVRRRVSDVPYGRWVTSGAWLQHAKSIDRPRDVRTSINAR